MSAARLLLESQPPSTTELLRQLNEATWQRMQYAHAVERGLPFLQDWDKAAVREAALQFELILSAVREP